MKLNNGDNRCVTTSTVGYMCLALTVWIASMAPAGWYGREYALGTSLWIPMAAGLGVMGILSHLRARSLDAVVFFGSAILFWSWHSASASVAQGPASYLGWYMAVWAVFYGYVWLGSFHSALPRQLFLLGMALTLFAFALNAWTSLAFFNYIAGYIGLVTALLAGLVSASGFISYGSEKTHSPNDDHAHGQTHAA